MQVNGITVTTLGTKVAESDQVSVDGNPVGSRERLTYIMLHKPAGYITTVQDTHSRHTVMELCGAYYTLRSVWPRPTWLKF